MLYYAIPGKEDVEIANIVLDYNGTLAVDGQLIEGVKERLNRLADFAQIYILSADTYGTLKAQCLDIRAQVLSFPGENAGASKRRILENLGGGKSLCIGNGFNDIPMFEVAALSIALIGDEGTSGQLLAKADILCRDILSGLDMLLHPQRIKATLRT